MGLQVGCMGVQPGYVGLQAAGCKALQGVPGRCKGLQGAAGGGRGLHDQAHLEAISRLCEGWSSLALLASPVSLAAAPHEAAARPGRAYV